LFRETGTDAAGEQEPSWIVRSNKQSTKVLATTSGWRVAADDKLLLLGQFDFNPRTAASASLVKRVRSFGDEAFELELLPYLEQLFSGST
jgi:hypothetical protein